MGVADNMLETLVITDEENPLLRRQDKGFTFANDPGREIAAARYFAEEINSGRLSVKDAYINYWSYEEDVELWGLPKDRKWRALLPAWEKILSSVSRQLDNEHTSNFVETLSQCYRECANSLRKLGRTWDYNPFRDDLMLLCNLFVDYGELYLKPLLTTLESSVMPHCIALYVRGSYTPPYFQDDYFTPDEMLAYWRIRSEKNPYRRVILFDTMSQYFIAPYSMSHDNIASRGHDWCFQQIKCRRELIKSILPSLNHIDPLNCTDRFWAQAFAGPFRPGGEMHKSFEEYSDIEKYVFILHHHTNIHNACKPQGYNPPVKKLNAELILHCHPELSHV
jgi:hypothetical protein